MVKYAVSCGSWYESADSKELAFQRAKEVIEDFAKDYHPWGDLSPHQLIEELEPNEFVNESGEINRWI